MELGDPACTVPLSYERGKENGLSGAGTRPPLPSQSLLGDSHPHLLERDHHRPKCAHKDRWEVRMGLFKGAVQLLCECVPSLQDFQEIEPVPSALVNHSAREQLGTPGYPQTARACPSSPAQLSGRCIPGSGLSQPVFASGSSHRGKGTPPSTRVACESPSLPEEKPPHQGGTWRRGRSACPAHPTPPPPPPPPARRRFSRGLGT